MTTQILRKNLYAWYNFKQDSSLLEIGNDCKALTELFKEKCSRVDCIQDGLPKEKYDYIILTGVLEKHTSTSCAAYLSELREHLNENGKLLIAVNNRYGFKYFCGEKDTHTGKIFDSIRNYPNGSADGKAFTKKELEDAVSGAGLKYKFYYPMSDYRYTQVVYTDKYLPTKSMIERLTPYYADKTTLIADERDMYNDVIDAGVFPFFSNSYLVECGIDDDFCNVIFAAISSDRTSKDACITAIYDDNTARKIPFCKDGVPNIHAQYNKLIELNNHGIKTIKHEIIDDTLVMPYVTAPKLSDYIRDIVTENKAEFVEIFDKLYDTIRMSSEHVSADKNALMNCETSQLEWGPILKKAYIELIPLNCFYINNEMHFFDQEFAYENYPAKYVMFRAVKYAYIHAPETEKYIPQKDMKVRYGLDTLWNIFENAENDFQKSLHIHENFDEFYSHTFADRNIIEQNIAKLTKTDKNAGVIYKPDKIMTEMRKIQLDLLTKIDEVCAENGLTYFMAYGTLLGAVRHKGFIPWDDDIDVVMPRKDYDKLIKLAFDEPYFLQLPENDPNCFHGIYARLRNCNTTGMGIADIGHDCNNGMWIDILPLDNCVRDPAKLKLKNRALKKAIRLLNAKVYGNDTDEFAGMDEELWEEYCIESQKYTHAELCQKLHDAVAMYTDEETDYLSIFSSWNSQPYVKTDFDEVLKLEFEDKMFNAPKGYHRVLCMSKGQDYMKFPPAHKQIPHHDGIFIPDMPYKKFAEMFNNIFDNTDGKTIVIFGAGIMVEDYLKRYGDKYPPAFLVDNDSGKWGKEIFGFTVKNPEKLKDIPNLHLIICSVYYREIEKQLNGMGITEFKVYSKEKVSIMETENRRILS